MIHLGLAALVVTLAYHKQSKPVYQPFELQLDSVHVHHYEAEKKTKTSNDSFQTTTKPVPAEAPPEKTSSSSSSEGGDKSSASSSGPANEISLYLGKMIQMINHQKFYPRLSLLNEEAGVVEVRVTLDSSGHLENAEIKKSSGFERLDAAALKTLQSISNFPPLPSALAPRLVIAVPIRYEVNPDH